MMIRSTPRSTILSTLLLCLCSALAACAQAERLESEKDAVDLSNMAVADDVAAAVQGKGDEATDGPYRGTLTCGEARGGSFDAEYGYHVYMVHGRPGQLLSVDLKENDGYSDMVVGVFAPDGDTLMAANDDCGPGTYDSCIHELELTQDRTYFVVATTYWSQSSGDYLLELACQGAGRAGDPCSAAADCGSDLLCARRPGLEEGTCRPSECGGPDNEPCTNAICRVFPESAAAYGWCDRPDHCDDGSEVICRRSIPICESGTILAYRGQCYECVDADTCEPPPAEPDCRPRGCSGQICASEPMVSTCDMRAEYRCLSDCRLTEHGCSWFFEPGSAAHDCLLELGRCAHDADCGAGQRCNARPGSWGSCEPTDEPCMSTGCFGEICAAGPTGDFVCPAFAPPQFRCLESAYCGLDGEGACGWQIPFDGDAHLCLLDLGMCIHDGDCADDEVCRLEEGAFGRCEELPRTGEGELCRTPDAECAAGLACIGTPTDGSDPYGVCRDVDPPVGMGDACTETAPCDPGLLCSGLSHFDEGICIADWMAGVFANEEPVAIPDDDPDGVSSSVIVRGLATVPTDVVLQVTIRHTWRGDLRVALRDPNGQEVVVWDRAGGWEDDLVLYGPVNGFSMDEAVNGRWTLHVSDLAPLDQGIIESWSLFLGSRWD